MPLPDPPRIPAPPALTALLLGTTALLPFVLFDVARSVQASTSAWIFGVALSCTLGGGLALLTRRVTRIGWLVAVAVLPAPVFGLPIFWWALRRTSALYPNVRLAFIPVAIVAVTLLVMRPLRELLERKGVRPPLARLLSVLAPPVLLIALLTGSFLTSILKAGIVFAIVQFIDGSITGPRIVGGSVGLHPVWVILALALGSFFFGFVGLLLAMPAAVMIKLLIREWIARYRNSRVFRGPAPASDVAI